MFNSKLFWGGILLCVVVFVGILLYRTSQPLQEPIKIYKIVVPEQHATAQSADTQKEQRSENTTDTEETSTSVESDVSIDSKNLILKDTQISEGKVQTQKSTSSIDSKEERYYGLTPAEIAEQTPMLEEEIRTNLTKAVELYKELRSTDGITEKSPELIAWRDETWQEVKQLFNDVSHTGKIKRYTSYLKATGVEEDPLLPGGWIFELTKSLPMRVTSNGTSH